MYLFSKTVVIGSSSRAHGLPSHHGWVTKSQVFNAKYEFLPVEHASDPGRKPLVLHNSHANIIPVGAFWLAGRHCSIQGQPL